MTGEVTNLHLGQKALIAARIWLWSIRTTNGLRKEDLPSYLKRVSTVSKVAPRRIHPVRLSRAIDKSLPTRTPRCIVRSIVLFRLLKEQGDAPELVIGMSETARDHTAHAWVELDHVDIGPRPGRHGHRELARFS